MIITDCETTGIDPSKTSILSNGSLFALERKDRLEVIGTFYEECRMRKGSVIDKKGATGPHDPGALAVNGFTEKQARDPKKQSLDELSKKLVRWAFSMLAETRIRNIKGTYGNISLAGNNISFDSDFLTDSFRRAGIAWPFGYRYLDLLPLIVESHIKRGIPIPLKDYRLNINSDYNFTYAGLPSEPKPHNALTGAKFTAEAFSRMMYGKILLPKFGRYSVPKYLKR